MILYIPTLNTDDSLSCVCVCERESIRRK